MSAIDNTPVNKNFLSPLNFKFSIKRSPHVNFFIQKVNIPSINLSSPEYPNPFVKAPIPGEHLDYGTLEITYKVDEDLQNYLELYNWIIALGKPENYDQYKNIQNKLVGTGEGIYSDITLMILSSTKMANYEVMFADAFPVSISPIVFNTTDSDVNYIESSATFRYTLFNINNI